MAWWGERVRQAWMILHAEGKTMELSLNNGKLLRRERVDGLIYFTWIILKQYGRWIVGKDVLLTAKVREALNNKACSWIKWCTLATSRASYVCEREWGCGGSGVVERVVERRVRSLSIWYFVQTSKGTFSVRHFTFLCWKTENILTPL